MSSFSSSIEREIDEYQDTSSGSYESGKGRKENVPIYRAQK